MHPTDLTAYSVPGQLARLEAEVWERDKLLEPKLEQTFVKVCLEGESPSWEDRPEVLYHHVASPHSVSV